jgi:hypothetical protein
MEKSIKKSNRKYIVLFIGINLLIFLHYTNILTIEKLKINDYAKLLQPVSLAALIFIILSIILEGLLSNKWKYFLIFFKLKHQLPGHRSFSELALKDPRIDEKKLKTILGESYPATPEEQNTIWYKYYCSCSNERKVFEAQKYFLLLRDLYSITIILIPIISFFYFLIVGNLNLPHIIALFIFALVTLISTRNYANGFVCNVLIEIINKKT